LIEGIDFYHDEYGYIVLTEKYHLKKAIVVGMAAGIALTNTNRYRNQNVLSYWKEK